MSFLSKADLLAAKSRRFAVVEVLGLGAVRLGSMSAATALKYRELKARMEGGENVERELMLLMISGSMVDGVGRDIFSADEAAQFLADLSVDTMEALVEQVNRLNSKEPKPGNSEASPSAS